MNTSSAPSSTPPDAASAASAAAAIPPAPVLPAAAPAKPAPIAVRLGPLLSPVLKTGGLLFATCPTLGGGCGQKFEVKQPELGQNKDCPFCKKGLKIDATPVDQQAAPAATARADRSPPPTAKKPPNIVVLFCRENKGVVAALAAALIFLLGAFVGNLGDTRIEEKTVYVTTAEAQAQIDAARKEAGDAKNATASEKEARVAAQTRETEATRLLAELRAKPQVSDLPKELISLKTTVDTFDKKLDSAKGSGETAAQLAAAQKTLAWYKSMGAIDTMAPPDGCGIYILSFEEATRAQQLLGITLENQAPTTGQVLVKVNQPTAQ